MRGYGFNLQGIHKDMGNNIMHRLLAAASIVTGGGTAGGVMTHSITEATAIVGAICAVATTIGTIWIQVANYRIAKRHERREEEEHRDH